MLRSVASCTGILLLFTLALIALPLNIPLLDSTELAFVGWLPYTYPNLHLADLDKKLVVRLTTHPASDQSPDWSPDGSKLVFSSEHDGDDDLYLINFTAEDRSPRQLTTFGSSVMPSWSPDGEQIVFVSSHTQEVELYTLTPATGEIRRLTTDSATDLYPAWSPDGTQIAFTSDRQGDIGLYLMDPNGGRIRRIQGIEGYPTDPAWSPDGMRIAYVALQQIAVIDIATDANTVLVRGAHPAWSPDGDQVVLVTQDRVIWIADVNGGWRKPFDYPGMVYAPAWRP